MLNKSREQGNKGTREPEIGVGCPTLGVPADRFSSVGWTLAAPLSLRLGWGIKLRLARERMSRQ
jgi:hypothetical protein